MNQRFDKHNLYEQLFRQASDAIVLYNEQNEIIDVNESSCHLFGYSREEMLCMTVSDLIAEEKRGNPKTRIQEELRKYGDRPFESVDVKKDGTTFTVEVTNTTIVHNQARYIFSVVRDVSARKQMEAELEAAEALEKSIIESPTGINIWAIDREYRYTFFNNAHREGMRYFWNADIELGISVLHYIEDPEYREKVRENYNKLLTGEEFSLTEQLTAPRGEIRYFENIGTPIRAEDGSITGATIFTTDITDQIRAERQLKESLREKETLLKEIHHRVKNNLQLIISMLNLQISASGDETIRTVLSESQNRITSMAMIHEQLYQSDSLAGINMHDYLDALIAFIMDSFDAKKKNITVDLSLPGITLDIDTAIPVGLIVNELVCNCMKYAFAKKDGGMITLTLTEEHGKQRSIVVEDNGEGLTPDFDVCNPGKLGLQMVTALAEQLGGTFAIANSSTGSGVRAVVEF